jgi:hypothetical protein
VTTSEPFIVKYAKDFKLWRIHKTFLNFGLATRTKPEVRFMKNNQTPAILQGRDFVFSTAEGLDSQNNNRPVIGVQITERIMGMEVDLCKVVQFKDDRSSPAVVMLLGGNVLEEAFIKDVLKIAEAVIRNHPDYFDPN